MCTVMTNKIYITRSIVFSFHLLCNFIHWHRKESQRILVLSFQSYIRSLKVESDRGFIIYLTNLLFKSSNPYDETLLQTSCPTIHHHQIWAEFPRKTLQLSFVLCSCASERGSIVIYHKDREVCLTYGSLHNPFAHGYSQKYSFQDRQV